MRAIIRPAGSLLGLLLVTAAASAYYPPWCNPLTGMPYPTAPDCCGPGWYNVGPCGMVYGPNYYLVPPWAPPMPCFGPRYNPQTQKYEMPQPCPPQYAQQQPQQPQQQQYPTHPFVRGPRDFFMWNESLEEQESRSIRPNLVPSAPELLPSPGPAAAPLPAPRPAEPAMR